MYKGQPSDHDETPLVVTSSYKMIFDLPVPTVLISLSGHIRGPMSRCQKGWKATLEIFLLPKPPK